MQSLRRMSQKTCRSFPFLDNSDQHYIVPALKRCVELLVNLCRSLVTYLYIARGPVIRAPTSGITLISLVDKKTAVFCEIIRCLHTMLQNSITKCYIII